MLIRIGIVVAAVAGLILLLALIIPAVKSRKRVQLGLVEGKLRPCLPSPNCVCSQCDSQDHIIEPLIWAGDATEGMRKLRRVLGQIGNARVVTESDNYLHAEFRSAIFGFVDDVEFLAAPEQAMIHVRSASRVGYSDLGANRKRVDVIRAMWGEPSE